MVGGCRGIGDKFVFVEAGVGEGKGVRKVKESWVDNDGAEGPSVAEGVAGVVEKGIDGSDDGLWVGVGLGHEHVEHVVASK